jgi:hypothetical protein
MAFAALYIHQSLESTDRETVELITQSPSLRIFIIMNRIKCLKPFDQSILVYFCKRIKPILNKICNNIITANGIKMIQELSISSQGEISQAEKQCIRPMKKNLASPNVPCA